MDFFIGRLQLLSKLNHLYIYIHIYLIDRQIHYFIQILPLNICNYCVVNNNPNFGK